ncbi:uncharacterized protein LOC125822197 [Solanum verrucosum]|uniref:uncharacterized protein LOC125822197 n=1 Tax=Solanum verrucosum TaxID=315347 RepID=UPI0020D18D65|nr:uncharacterized protein LOC125822197 [Solanum verrucosum]
MQQIAELRAKLQKNQDLSILVVVINNSSDGMLPLHFPPLNSNSEHVLNNPLFNPVQNPSTINLTIPNLHHTNTAYQTPAKGTKNPPNAQSLQPKVTFDIPVQTEPHLHYTTYSQLDHYEEKEKEWRAKEEKTKKIMKEEIAKVIKELDYSLKEVGMNYENLCIHPDFDLPEGSKVPKCVTFNEVAPDRYYLEKIKQRSTENYREYGLLWRKEAARVQPPMSKREITEMVIRTQEPQYYERKLCMMGQKFVKIVKLGEVLEDGFKTGKVTNLTALRASDKPTKISGVNTSKGKVEEVYAVTVTHMQSALQRRHQNHNVNQKRFPRPNFRNPPKVFTPLRESQTQLYERLRAMCMLHPIEGRPTNPLGEFYRADHKCAYHPGTVGHDTENCSTLKHKIQNMINNNLTNIN